MPGKLSNSRWRWILYIAILIAVFWIWVVFLILRFQGDRSWFGTIAIFAPRWLLVAPAIPALLLTGCLRWRSRLVLALVILIPCVGALGFCLPWHGWVQERAIVYRVLSCNVANWDGGAEELKRLIYETRADVILLQEFNDQEHLSIPEDWFECREGELKIASRFPISDVHSVMSEGRWPRCLGLFCKIETLEQTLPIANIHISSPRHGLTTILDAQTLLAPSRRELLVQQTAQREFESQRLATAALRPDGALVVAGDFNMPVESVFFRDHWKDFGDAFSTVGFGFGHTTHVEAGGLIRYGARIDHVLTRGNWCARRCWVGFDVGSDHLPLLADLYFSE